jgi:hypothetical protein
LIIFSTATLSLAGQSTTGNGNIIEDERKVAEFSKLSVSHGIDVEITQGNSNKVIIVTDENLQEKIIVKVEGDELQIYVEDSIYKAKKMTAVVTVKKLNTIKASSGSDVESKNMLVCDVLTIQCKSGSDIELDLEANSVSCKLTRGSDAELNAKVKESVLFSAEHGSDIEAKLTAQSIICYAKHGSDFDLSGKTNKLEIEASGGSDISASNLIAEDCKLNVSGGSDAKVHSTESIDIHASSASDVYYSGNPEHKNIHANSGADVHSR